MGRREARALISNSVPDQRRSSAPLHTAVITRERERERGKVSSDCTPPISVFLRLEALNGITMVLELPILSLYTYSINHVRAEVCPFCPLFVCFVQNPQSGATVLVMKYKRGTFSFRSERERGAAARAGGADISPAYQFNYCCHGS